MEPFEARLLKSLLRNKLRQSLKQIPDADRKRRSAKIIEKLMRTKVFQRSKNIFTYVALPDEVQTEPLIWKSIAVRKNVFVPKIHPGRKTLSIFRISNPLKDLKPGKFGVLEPKPKATLKARPEQMDLFIVPGLGFDSKGRRLGRGEGYFDRFLKKTGRTPKWGLAFHEQRVDLVPIETHDICVDKVITD